MTTETVTGATLLQRFGGNHPHPHDCPKCGEDINRTSLVNLAYRFESCGCDRVDYDHLIERIWHLSCLIEDAPAIEERELLWDAAQTLNRYVKGRSLGARIEAVLERRALGEEGE